MLVCSCHESNQIIKVYYNGPYSRGIDNRFRTPNLELKCLGTSFGAQKQKFLIRCVIKAYYTHFISFYNDRQQEFAARLVKSLRQWKG